MRVSLHEDLPRENFPLRKDGYVQFVKTTLHGVRFGGLGLGPWALSVG